MEYPPKHGLKTHVALASLACCIERTYVAPTLKAPALTPFIQTRPSVAYVAPVQSVRQAFEPVVRMPMSVAAPPKMPAM